MKTLKMTISNGLALWETNALPHLQVFNFPPGQKQAGSNIDTPSRNGLGRITGNYGNEVLHLPKLVCGGVLVRNVKRNLVTAVVVVPTAVEDRTRA
jgi:hypothetical protein